MANKSETVALPFTPAFDKAVADIELRAERQDNEFSRKLQEVFVDFGQSIQVQSNKNQIIMGRRGSGKTHLLLSIHDFVGRSGGWYIFIDLRRIISNTPNISEVSPYVNAGKIVSALLNRILEIALDDVLRLEAPSTEKKSACETAWSKWEYYVGRVQDPIGFCGALENFLHAMGYSKCVLVLDEWSSIPTSSQPFVADFLKRAFIPSPRIVIKIAAIDFNSLFSITAQGGGRIGLELGADIFRDVELDSVLIYDKDRIAVGNFFGRMLFNHLTTSLSFPLYPEDKKSEFIIQLCFTQESVFTELVRASEGVPRDFLHIFELSYFKARTISSGKIPVQVIRTSAADWYRRDKVDNIREEKPLVDLLSTIYDEAIGKKRARTFLVNQKISRHPLLLKLFDSRLIHFLKRGWSHADKPGDRYDIFSIDYGAYVDLINTNRAPQRDFFEEKQENEADDVCVPFDDYRSIRRIELTREMLEKFTQKAQPQ